MAWHGMSGLADVNATTEEKKAHTHNYLHTIMHHLLNLLKLWNEQIFVFSLRLLHMGIEPHILLARNISKCIISSLRAIIYSVSR